MTESVFGFLLFGLIQSLTEFVPVSSSGHLALIEGLFGDWSDPGPVFILVNGGTLLALVWACWGPLKAIITEIRHQPGLLTHLLVATTPAAAAGWFLADYWESLAGNLWLVGIMLFGVGLLMVWQKPAPTAATSISAINFKIAWMTGWAQALALIPGTSRAGATILAGVFSGFSPQLAAQWSFLMAIPIIVGALAKTIISESGQALLASSWPELLAANLLAFVVGFWVLGWLLALVGRYSLRPFGYYRLVLGGGLLIWLGLNAL